MTGTVLLVDDNETLRSGLASVLEREGIRVEQAAQGSEAIALALRTELDLAVLDLNLPDMTGVNVYQSLPNKDCIFMTAEASQDLVDEALALEPIRLLRKPFEISLFRRLVRRVMEMKR